jgi:gliding motility-associated-like protein
MKQLYRLFVSLFVLLLLTDAVNAQSCSCSLGSLPTYTIDLSGNPDTTVVVNSTRGTSHCCTSSGSDRCIKFIVTVNANSTQFGFSVSNGNNGLYWLDCNGTGTAPGTPLCLTGGVTTFCVTYCNPGGNADDYTLSASRGFVASADLVLRAGSTCTGLMRVQGIQKTSINWTSIAPGALGAYNSFLSCTTGCDTTYVTPVTVAPNTPSYIDYKVCGTSIGCSSGTFCDTVRVYTVPAMTVAITPANPAICSAGGNVTLTATPTGGNPAYSYTWTAPNGFTSTSQSPTVTVAQTYSVSVKDNTDCSPVVATKTVTTNTTPTITSASTGTACSGVAQNYTITADVIGTTYTWSRPLTTGISNAAVSGQTANPITEALINTTSSPVVVNYTITPTAGGCPGSPFTYAVTVNPTPVVTNAATASTCSATNPSLSLTASVPSSFSWTIGTITGGITGASAGSGATINQVLTNPSSTAAGTVQYIVTPTSTTGGCVGSPYTITVTVNPKPVVTNASAYSICNATSPNLALTASVASSFSWTIGTISGGITGASSGSGATINQTLTNPSGTTAGSVQYIVTPTSTTGSCTGTAYTITITVNPKPAVTNSGTTTICSGTSPNTTLTASVPSTFTWTIGTNTGGITGASAGSGTTLNQTLTNPSNSAAGSIEYLVTPTSTTGSCVGAPYSIVITVNPKPVVTNPATASTCSGTNPSFTLTASTPSSFAWTVGTITGGITGASAGSGSTSINQILTNPSNTTAGTVQYIITPTSSLGCVGTPYTITITVNPTPAVTNPATYSICSATATNIPLTASAASTFTWTIGTISGGITGATAGSGSTIAQTLTNPSNSAAGTVQYIVTPTSTTGSCAGAPYTITVTVNPTPAVTNAATASICSATSPNIALTASAPSTFAWTIGTITGSITGATAASGTTLNQTLTNSSNTTAGTVQYIVTPTSATGSCPGAPYTITITVNPTPAVTNAATTSICSGTSPAIALTSSTPSTFAWTIGTISGGITGATAGSGSSISQTLTNPSNAVAGSVQYIVTPTSTTGSCAGAPYTITVTVNPIPAVTNAATTAICNATSPNIALTSSAPSTFAWTIGTISGGITGATAGSGATINQTLTNPGNSAAGTVQYIVTPTSTTGGCAGAPYTITVTVNPTPAVTNAATTAICTATSPNITLTSSAPSTFAWTIGTVTGSITGASAGSGTTINQTLTNPSNATAGTVQYIVTPTSTTGSCVGAPYTITVTVNPKPVVTNPATAAICNATSPNITLTSSAPSTFAWTVGTISGGITGATAGSGTSINDVLTNPSNATAGTVQYIVTPTSTAGCVGTPYTITITVNPKPAVTNPAAYSICSATATNIPLTSSAPSTFAWTIGTISGGITGATAGSGSTIAQTLTNPSNSAAGTVQYLVTPTSSTGSCAGSPYTITVTVNPTPAVTNPATATICSGTSPNITLASSAPATFTWTIGTISGGITGASAGSGGTINQTLTNPSNTVAGSVKYIITPTSTTGSCPGAPYTITVTVNPAPSVTNAANYSTCNNTSPNIALTSTVPSSFTWTIGTISGGITGATAGGGSAINDVLTNPSNSAAGTVQYIVTPTATTGSCPGAPYTITVTVNPTPAVTNAGSTSICTATSPNIALTASAPSTFAWTIGTINGGITGATAGSGATINQTLTNPSNSAAGTVQYIVTPTSTTGGCAGAPYTITVTVNPKPAVTNPATAAICNATSPNISLTASAPSTFTWTIGTISGSVTGASSGSGSTINQTLTNPSNATAGSVQYIVTPTSVTGSCVGAPYTITVTVNPTPAVTNAATKAICNNTNTNIALTASAASTFAWTIGTITGGITGATAGSASTISQTLLNPSNTTAGTVQYIVTPTSTTGSCVGAPFTITVTVNPTPAVTNAANTSICSGTSPNITLTSSAPSTFAWTIGTITGGITGATSGSGTIINQTLTNPGNATAGTVEYIVTPTATTGSCPGAPYSITVTVNPKPAVTNSATATICSATSPNIALTASAPSTFTWTIGTISGGITGASAGSGNTINQTLTNPGNAVAGTVQYIVTPTSVTGSCVGAPYTITVTVNPTPAVTNAATKAICNNTNTNIALSASAPSTFTWTIGTINGGITGATAGSGSTISQVLVNPSNSAAGTVQYIVTPTSVTGSCAGAPYTITVTVNPTPAVTNAAATSICSGTSPNIALTSSAPSTFAWTIGTITGSITGASAGSGSTINQTLTNPSNTSAGTVEYIVTPTATTGSCPGAPYTITVTVNPKPAVTNPATVATCTATSPNISLTASAPSTFTWTIGTISGGITGASAGAGSTINQVLTNPGNAVAGTVQYIITPTSVTGGCVGAPYTITVTVNPAPAVTNAATYSTCNNTSPNIALTSTVPSTFTWTIGTINGGITGATAGSGSSINQVLTNPSNTTAGTVQYIVTPTATTGNCPGAPYTITVTVNPTPAVTNAAATSICSGTSPNIALTASAASTFAWTIGNITGSITGASAGSGTTINQTLTNPSNATAGTVEYIVTPTATTGSCPGAPYTITVTVNPKPAVTNPATVAICSATSPNISLTSSAPATFTWTIGTISGGITGASAGSGNTINQTLTNPSNAVAESVQYIITPTSVTGTCVGAPYTITVTVNPSPAVTNAATYATCNNTSPNIALTSTVPSTFTWTIGTISGGITGATAGSGSSINQVLQNPSNTTAGTVQYIVTPTATTGNCPGAPYTITVTVNPTPAVTNAAATSICSGTSPNIALTASAPSSFAWTIGNITGSITGASAGSGTTINQTLTNPSNASAGTVEYIVTPTATTGSCPGAPYTITVTVNPKPAVTNPASVATCTATSPNITLTASAPSTFTWTIGIINGSITGASAGSGGSINQVLTNPSNAIAGTVQYIVTPTSVTGGCVGAPYTITVTVNPAPAVTNPAAYAICNATSPNIALTSSAPSTFAWTIGTISGGITGATAGTGNTINQVLTNPSSTTAGSVKYIVTPTSTTGSCAGAPFTITVTVNPTPVVTNSPTDSICNATSPNIALTASTPSTFAWTIGNITGSITGASAGSGTTINQTLTNPSNATAGSVEYLVTPTAVTGGCVGAPYTITITVNPTPAVTNAATKAICNNTSTNIALTATAPSNFAWTIGTISGGITGATPGSGSTINQTLTNPSNAVAGTVQYIVTPTSVTGNCAGAPFTITVTVNPTPAVTNAATKAICNNTNTNISLTSSAPATFAWTIGTINGGITGATAGSGSTISQVLQNPSNAAAGSVQYIVTPTSTTGSCAGAPYTITVTVNPTPVVTNPASAAICNATSPNIALTASAPSTFAWTIGNITGSISGATAGSGTTINQTLTNPSNATAGTVEYIVTPTSVTGSCPGAPYTITITVNPRPAVTNPATLAICNNTGTNISLTSSAPANFSWTVGTITGGITGASAGAGSTINQTLTNPSNATAGTVQYIITPVSVTGNCTGTPYTITVTVNPTPAVTNPNTLSICNATSPNIALTATAPSTFTWTIGTINGGITGATSGSGSTISQTLNNPSNSAAGTVQYIVTPTSTTGTCPGAPYTITVTVNPTPAVTNPSTVAICNATSPNIALAATAPSTFAWTIGNITGSITGASAGSGATINQTLTNPSNSASGTVEYIVTPTSTTGNCAGAPYTITVTVNPTPVVTNPATTSICNNTSTNINLTSSAPANFSWTIGTITGGITGATAGAASSISQTLTNPSNSTAGSVQYIVTPVSVTGNCTGAPYTITVTVNPTPAVTTANNATICSGTSPNIALSSTSSSTFTWTIGAINGGITGATAGSGNIINQTLTNPGNATAGSVEYIVTPTSTTGSCPGAPFSITVTVNPIPSMTTPPATSICNGGNPNISLTASTPSTFTWTIGTVTGGITGATAGTGAVISQILNNPSTTSSGSVEYIVTPTSNAGCVGAPFTITATVTVYPTPAMTNAPTASTCDGTGPNITLTATTPSTFIWTIGTITGGISGAVASAGPVINQTLTNPSSTTAGTVQYIVTPTSIAGGCPGAPFTITVTVNPTPVVTNPAAVAICNGTSPNIALTSSAPSAFAWTIGSISGGITGATAGSGSTINQTLYNPSNSTAGSVEYIVTPTSTSGSCPGNPYTITVTVNPTPAVTNPATMAICSGSNTNIAVTTTAASNITWTIGTITGGITGATSGAGSNINQVLTNPGSATAGSVEYIITPTSSVGNCVGVPYTITVTVNPTPAVTNPAAVSICNATSPNISLTSTAGSSFAWTIGNVTGGITGASAGSGSLINQVLTNPGNSTAGIVEYIITPTSTTGSCPGVPYKITVTVNPTPVVTNSSSKAICNGTNTNIALTSSTPSTFTWSIGSITGSISGASSGSGSNISQVLTNPSNANAGTVEYIVTPTSVTGNCAGAPYSIVVTVNPTPVVTNPPSHFICNGTNTNLTLTSSSPSNFTWTIGTISGGITGASAGAGSVISQTLSNPSNSTAGTVQYIVTPTSSTGNCPGSPYTITVTVNPTPVVTTPAAVTICNGGNTNINLTATAPSSFAWSIGNVTGGITGATPGSGSTISQVLNNPSNSAAGSVQYIVTLASNAGNCVGSTYTITVTVNPTPVVTNQPTASICNGTSPNINLTASTPSTFAWTIGAVTGSISGATAGSGPTLNQTLTNPGNSSAGTVQYIVTPTSTAGSCPGVPYTITITVNPTPVVTNPATVAICNATSPNISLTSSTPSNFTWTVGTITGGITGASSGAGNLINQTLTNPSNSTAGTVQYIVTPTSSTGNCAGAPYTITVTVNPKPAVTNANAASICSGTSPNITLTSTVTSNYTWTIGAINGGITGASAGSGSTISQVLTNPGNTSSGSVEYIVTPTSATGTCPGAPYSIVVTVNPRPVVTNASSLSICNGSNTNLALTSSAPSTFTWTIGAINGSISGASAGSGSTISQTLTNPGNSSAGSVEYIVTPTSTTGGCTGTPYSITVTVNPTPVVTNAPTAEICNGTATNISLTSTAPSNFTWTVGTITGGITGATAGGGSFINQTLSNPGNSTAGTVQYIVTPTSTTGNCVGAPYTITVTVNPTPVVTNPAATAICTGTSPNINLTASTTSSFSWTIGAITGGITGASAGGGSLINQVLNNPGNSTPGSVQYIVTPISINGGCAGAPYTITVTVNPKPAVTTPSNITSCSGTNPAIALTSTTPSTFTWTVGTVNGSISGASAGSGSTINQVLTNPSNTTTGTVEYIVTPTSNTGCVGSPYSIMVTVYPYVTVTSSATNGICNNMAQNYLITGSIPGTTFTWSRPAVAGISNPPVSGQMSNPITEALNNTTASTISVDYTIIPSANGCAGEPFTYTLTVYSTPDVTSAPRDTVCSGEVQNYLITSAVTAATFSWDRPAVAGISNGAVTGQTVNPIDEVLYNTTDTAINVKYIITPSASGCSTGAPFTYTVTVNPNARITSPASGALCSGLAQNYQITSNVPSATFVWSRAAVTGISNAAVTNQTTNTITESLVNTTNAPIVVTYRIQATAFGCPGTAFNYNVTVNPPPTVTSRASDSVCSEVSLNYNITSAVSGTVFTWDRATVAGISNPAVSGQTANPITEALVNTTGAPVFVTYTITPSANGCSGTPFTYTVKVNPTPLITTSRSQTMCSGNSTNVPLTATTPSTFSWTIGAITGGVTGASAGSGNTINQVLTNPSNSTAGSVQYIVTPVSLTGNCTRYVDTITITVNPKPIITNASTMAICTGGNPNISITSSTASTYTWTVGTITGGITGATAGSGNLISQVLNNPSNSTAGSVKYIITPTSIAGNCGAESDTITVTVNPKPVMTTAAADTVCSQSSTAINLTATTASTFTWTVGTITGGITGASAGSGSAINQVLTNPSNSAAGTVQYIVTPTSTTGGCPGTPINITVTVNPKPVMTTPPATSICNGGNPNIPLSASTASTFSWTIGTVTGGITGATAGSGSVISQVLTNPSTTSSGTVEYIVTPVSASGCVGSPFSIIATVTVFPTPVITNLPTTNTCNGSGANINLTATTPSTFAWTVGPITGGITGASAGTGASINQPLTNPGNSTAGTVKYIITATSVAGGCPSQKDTITVTVNPTPLVTSRAADTTCNNIARSYTITSSVTGANFSWSRPAIAGIANPPATGNSNSISEALNNSTASPINVPYTITASANGCTGPSFTYTLTVNPTPAVISVSTATVCSGTALNYSIITAVPSSTLTWTRSAVAGISNPPAVGNTQAITETLINTTTAPIDVMYIITPMAYGCNLAPPFTLTVTVKPTPVVTAVNDGPKCAGSTLSLTSTSTLAGSAFSWTGPAGFSSTQQNPTVANVSAANQGDYFVTANLNGCASIPVKTTVLVSNVPAQSNAGPDQAICSNNSLVTLSGSITGGSTSGIWSTTGSGTFAPNNTALNATYNPSPSDILSGGVTLNLSTTNTGVCPTSTDATLITFTPSPTVNAGGDRNICADTVAQLNGLTTVATGVMWSTTGSGVFVPDATSATASYVPSPGDRLNGSVRLYLTTTGNGNCNAVKDSIMVTIVPLPVVDAGPDVVVLEGGTVTLTPTVSGSNLQFLWTPNIYMSNNTMRNPVVTGVEDELYTITVTGTNNCVARDDVYVKVLRPFKVPNTFSPNGDGINDTWVIDKLSTYPGSRVQVFNRYGQVVFDSYGYPQPWDGTMQGKKVPFGTYYYIIEPGSGRKPLTGYVTVLK